ncbi:MAG TPA: tRNA (5-methylaminomethyl-2-thiouridine)(34)-methyltransferase MnmD [Chitinophagaceae bacterium]|nr:tRNA (5-methylaminomethyl-2-thiouridine)(34)-methyltransferase MnmD [Chitinophagaceae bacterium]
MKKSLIITKDGSHTISIPGMNVTYHSHHGAIQESMQVFINAGLKYLLSNRTPEKVHIFEMGFGTGLNALLTLIEAEERNIPIQYTAIELFPLTTNEASALNYCDQLNRKDLSPSFEQLHQCEWEKDISISPYFTIHKLKNSLLTFKTSQLFQGNFSGQNLIYFDAFAPAAQPELWAKEIFEMLYSILMPEGILVTYCSKGEVRRAMQAVGFVVEKIAGPPGKREMVRAIK